MFVSFINVIGEGGGGPVLLLAVDAKTNQRRTTRDFGVRKFIELANLSKSTGGRTIILVLR